MGCKKKKKKYEPNDFINSRFFVFLALCMHDVAASITAIVSETQ